MLFQEIPEIEGLIIQATGMSPEAWLLINNSDNELVREAEDKYVDELRSASSPFSTIGGETVSVREEVELWT